MRSSFLLIGLVFCLITFLQAQHSSSSKAKDKLYSGARRLFYNLPNPTPVTDQQAFVKYQEARQLYLQERVKNDTLADIYLNIGLYYHFYQEKPDYQAAIDSYQALLELQRDLHQGVDTVLFKPYLLLGKAYLKLNNYEKVGFYLDKAERIAKRYPLIQDRDQFYNLGGVFYYALGDYQQCSNYFEKTIAVLKQAQDPDSQAIVDNSINIASAKVKLGKYQDALATYKQLLIYRVRTNDIYHNIGFTYSRSHQYDSALIYLNQVTPRTINHRITLYNNLGDTHFHLNNSAKAIAYYDSSIQLNVNNRILSESDLVLAHLGKGQVYEANNQVLKALNQYQTAFQSFHFNFPASDIYQNPDFTSLNNIFSGLQLFQVLQQKANALKSYAIQTKKIVDLATALQTYQLALRLADRIRKSYDSDEAKLFFTNTVFPVYEQAISTAFQLYNQDKQYHYLETAFAFAERSKAAVLAESLRELDLKQIPGIPESLLQQERQLKQEITSLNLRLTEEPDSQRRAVYRESIRNDEMALGQQTKEFEANKQYYQLKYDTSSVKIGELQNLALDENTALVEYFLGKDQAYVFIVTRQGFEARQLPLTKAFRQQVVQLQKALYSFKAGATYQGDRPAFALYQQLLQPLRPSLQGIDRLVIVPDAELNYVPFEALVTNAEGRYLIEDYTISYAYSGTLLRNALNRPSSQSTTSLLAMAPFAAESKNVAQVRNNTLAPLAASKEEVERIGGEIYLAGKATKDLFIKTAGSYGVIHLATHAQADNSDPLQSFIAFYPGNAHSLTDSRLYTQELYNLSLSRVRLVVLSACETGSGQLVRGEGVMSLARAFAYAGCPNIITTLWKAEDQATADISAQMHEYLKEGKTKDQALRLAKLDYLDQAKGRKRAPFYWANFIFIGDNAPLYQSHGWIGWAVGGLLVLVALGFIYRKKLFARQKLPLQE